MAYYVTVQDGARVGYLAGPFKRHGDAVRMVDAAKHAAKKADTWAAFYAFGTAHVKTAPMVARIGTGKLNGLLGIDERSTV